jgi:hypothetical protein
LENFYILNNYINYKYFVIKWANIKKLSTMILYLKRIINIKKENSREHSKSNNNDKDSKNNKKLSKK